VLKARGLDAEKMIAGYRDWRVARGFLGPDPLAGIITENAAAQIYAAMDRSTQKALADTGDLGAIQAYAAGSLPGDPFTALKYYGHASELGSAAAMAQVASILSDFGSLQPGAGQNDRPFADKLLALRGGNPNRDLRQDAVAWTLASIRQYGPILATPANMELVGDLESNPDEAVAMAICGQSLAILASLSAATAGKDTATLPPVFVTEKNLYDRLPCRDTPAPVTPPRALEACTSSPAIGSNDQPVELWICPEN
jgi:TPR repeat protein